MPDQGNGCDQRQWVLSALDEHECRWTRYAIRMAGDEEAARESRYNTMSRSVPLCRDTAKPTWLTWNVERFSDCQFRAWITTGSQLVP